MIQASFFLAREMVGLAALDPPYIWTCGPHPRIVTCGCKRGQPPGSFCILCFAFVVLYSYTYRFPKAKKGTNMPDLIAPHGGLSEPVCRTVPEEARDDFLAQPRSWSRFRYPTRTSRPSIASATAASARWKGRWIAGLRSRAGGIGLGARREALCLDHPPVAAGGRGERPARGPGPGGGVVRRRRPHRRRAGNQRRFSLGQTKISPARCISPIARTIPVATWSWGATGIKTTCWAAQSACCRSRSIRASAATCSRHGKCGGAGREGLEPGGGLPDAKPSAPRPRIRVGVRPGDALAGHNAGACLNPLRAKPRATTCRPKSACGPTRP